MGVSAVQHSFSGHETFPFRYPWLKKGFDAALEDGQVFLRDDAITTLGVGKNMVRSIRHWCLAAGVLAENREGGPALQPTDLGTLLLADDGLDPYLEDPATLWLLHWQIASSRGRAATWFWTFSYFHEPEFTREALTSASTSGRRRSPASRSPKAPLSAMWRCSSAPTSPHGRAAGTSPRTPSTARWWSWVSSPSRATASLPLPPRYPAGTARRHPAVRGAAILGGILADSRDAGAERPGRQPGSPGRLFKIDESSLAERLEGIERQTDGSCLTERRRACGSSTARSGSTRTRF